MVHGLGTEERLAGLPKDAVYRLGLSATPERAYDPEGTAALEEYFGEVVYKYTLRQAIDDGFLCRYNYHVQFVELSKTESDEYLELSREYAKIHSSEKIPQEKKAHLLIKRARIVDRAEGKIKAFTQLIDTLIERNQVNKTLIYCADEEQLAEAGRILNSRPRPIAFGKITSETSQEDRKRLVTELERNVIRCILAIRILDEGIDIPSATRAIILASTTNPRQFIQRRGRVLRLSPTKVRAEVFDIFMLPPSKTLINSESIRTMIKNEVNRAKEFARTAENHEEIQNLFEEVLENDFVEELE